MHSLLVLMCCTVVWLDALTLRSSPCAMLWSHGGKKTSFPREFMPVIKDLVYSNKMTRHSLSMLKLEEGYGMAHLNKG